MCGRGRPSKAQRRIAPLPFKGFLLARFSGKGLPRDMSISISNAVYVS